MPEIKINKKMKIVWRDPATMQPNPRNHREHPEDQRAVLRVALGDEGWIDPIIYNKHTGNIVDGHLRAEEAIAAGVEQVPVIEIDVDEVSERKILVRHDRVTALAEINMDILIENAKGLDDLDIDMEELGWDASLVIEPEFGEDEEPDPLPPPPIEGDDDRMGRFLLLYEGDDEKAKWMAILGLENDSIVVRLEDIAKELLARAEVDVV